MDDSLQFKHLEDLLAPINDTLPSGENLDEKGDEDFIRIELDIEQANESKEWNTLKKNINKLLIKTKDLRLAVKLGRTLLQTETQAIQGLAQGLFLTREYIKHYWDSVYPPEDHDDPDERHADRINAIAELGSWASIVLPLRKKHPLLNFEGIETYYLEDLVAFQNGNDVNNKQAPQNIIEALSNEEKTQITNALIYFKAALTIAEDIKNILSEKTEIRFIDFDTYLLPNLQEGIAALSELTSTPEAKEEGTKTTNTSPKPETLISPKIQGSINSRDDVVKALDMICGYYTKNEPSSPLPLLLRRARGIVHKDFLEVLKELVPDSVSMTEPVFGKDESIDNDD